jgi:hypothetical protein
MVIIANSEYGYTPTMDTDGTAGDILIPSVHIPKEVAYNLTLAADGLSKSQKIVLSVEWYLPRPDGRVEMELWTSAGEVSTRSLVDAMAALTEAHQEEVRCVCTLRVCVCECVYIACVCV